MEEYDLEIDMHDFEQNDEVWLVKEKRKAIIASKFTHTISHLYGRIKLLIDDEIQEWIVSDDGNGLDGMPLIRPIKTYSNFNRQYVKFNIPGTNYKDLKLYITLTGTDFIGFENIIEQNIINVEFENIL
jgi:hypothetical protein